MGAPDQIVVKILNSRTKRHTLYARGEIFEIYRRDDWGRVDSFLAGEQNARPVPKADSPRSNAASFRVTHGSQAVGFLRPKTKKAQQSWACFGGEWTRTTEDRSRGIYSPLQLPLCDTPRMGILLAKGIEPSTIRLQVGRSTN